MSITLPKEYTLLTDAISDTEIKIKQLIQDRQDLDDYNLPDDLGSRLRECIDSRIRELIAEKTRYALQQIEIENKLLSD